jgi:DNA transposition AAA+ family ATPase
VKVVERAVADAAGVIDEDIPREALAVTYARNARGMLIRKRWRDALRLWRAARAQSTMAESQRMVRELVPFAARRLLHTMLRRS